ncbi:MAG: arginine--tRNA ligase [Candidatus Micrarchaeota archaeon]
MDTYSKAKQMIIDSILEACGKAGFAVTREEVQATTNEAHDGFGDVACTIAFPIAKKEKKNPNGIAESIRKEIKEDALVSEIKVVGPYINFMLGTEFFSNALGEIEAQKDLYGRGEKKDLKIMVEFPAVNPNKPWHVGHMRNALLGDTISRVLDFSGFSVQRIDYIDDLGMQVARSLWSYMDVDSEIEGKTDQWLGVQYIEAAKRIEERNAENEVREIVKKLEDGGNAIAKKGRELCSKCVKAQYKTAYELGIYHDALIWESDIVKSKLMENALSNMLKSGAVENESEGANSGCVIAKLSGEEGFRNLKSPDKVLIRSDGTATYTAKDIAFHMWKFGIIKTPFKYSKFDDQPNGKSLYATSGEGEEMDFGDVDVVINIIGVEQKYPQKVLKTILKAMGHDKEAAGHVHLSYEHAWLPECKFSGRDGTWIGHSADEVITEAEKRAYNEIKERFKDMGEEEKAKIAKSVGIGAIRFSFIRTTPEKKLIFRWEDALSFEGDSAPYVQYSYARASRILEKAGNRGKPDYGLLTGTEEVVLGKLLSRFSSIVAKSAREYRPHYIAEYALDIATVFNRFYKSSPVLKAEGNLRDARLGLVNTTKIVLRNALSLLGIDAPERM